MSHKTKRQPAQSHPEQGLLNILGMEREQDFLLRMERKGIRFVEPQSFEEIFLPKQEDAA